ncbi:hypothetical protein [Chryseobacterium sp.]|uniref:hypothetical protein n=1 Tax=Chryseobacterium sp. TaxID=1871047 RepID=UPI0025C29E25|nr:hypothetical protein [Chryseobacterium sp.]MBV8327719.1 hypothetical protein [Chryseobacterium sp.]
MKKISLTLLLLWTGYLQACDACKLQQPKITRNLTHGTGPDSNWDWIIVGIVTAITLATLVYSFKFLIKPGEKNKTHIKNNILNF